MKKKILVIVTILFMFGCEKMANSEWFTWLKNESRTNVYFYINFKKISDKEYRPSTQWPDSFNDRFLREVNAESEKRFTFRPYKYINTHREDSLSVFVFSPDTLEKYSIEKIKATNNYLKRFDIQIKDIDGDIRLTYSGNTNE